MLSIKSLIAASTCVLAFSSPALSSDWSAPKVYGPALDSIEAGLKAIRTQAAGALVAKNASVEVVELPGGFDRTKLPAAFAPVLASYEKALEAIRETAKSDLTVVSALRARGLDVDDVVAVGKTDDGSLRIVVDAA